MLFAVPFVQSDLRDLHRDVRLFMRRLRYAAQLPVQFSSAVLCSGELLARVSVQQDLHDKVVAFYAAWMAASDQERGTAYEVFLIMNRIPTQLDGSAVRYTIDDVPAGIRDTAKAFFTQLYATGLTKTRYRSHWQNVYKKLPMKTCPFCGTEILHHYDISKQDYDHILCKSIYSFAAVNLENLVPCGADCNRIFKNEADIIFDAGTRRKAFNPFLESGVQIEIDLAGSRLPLNGNDPGEWKIALMPDLPEINTWATVFQIERRYGLEIYAEHYDTWRQDFIDWARPQPKPQAGWDEEAVRSALLKYAGLLRSNRYRDRRFLKEALYIFLAKEAGPAFYFSAVGQLNAS